MIKHIVLLFFLNLFLYTAPVAAAEEYDKSTVLDDATSFFGDGAEGLGQVLEKIFKELGRPNAIIKGEEASAAFTVGARYGSGKLQTKQGGLRTVHWTGPSLGFDVGANASKVYVLVYNLPNVDSLFRRFPALDGSLYVIGGVSANYHQAGKVILAPVRLGAGLRMGVNVGYMKYTREKTWNPF